MDLLIAFTDCYKTLRKPFTLLQTFTDLLIALIDYYKTFSTHYKPPLICYSLYRHTTLHSVADISKQISKG